MPEDFTGEQTFPGRKKVSLQGKTTEGEGNCDFAAKKMKGRWLAGMRPLFDALAVG
ncbi:MAG: hypothetical protein LBP50_08045 [Tannerella sp.]|nr:hypothetical protein [Tannerella sp.]